VSEEKIVRLSILWSDEARADLRRIDRQTALDILHCADRYLSTRNGDMKKLKPSQTGSASAAATIASSLSLGTKPSSKSLAFAIAAKPIAKLSCISATTDLCRVC
jgi:hypothetical protein